MALPTLAEIRPVALAWWRAPGRALLSDLRARIAGMITAPQNARSSVSITISAGTLTLTLSQWDQDGVPLAPITRSFTATDFTGGPTGRVDLDDIVEDGDKRTRRQRAAAVVDAGGSSTGGGNR